MKRLKLIPLLTILAVLSGCNNVSAKEPSFGTMGDQVSKTEFDKRFQKVQNECEFAKEDIKFGDRVFSFSTIQSTYRSTKNGSKEKEKSESKTASAYERRYDFDNLVIKYTSNETVSAKTDTQEGNGTLNSTEKKELQYQYGAMDGEEYLFEINLKTKSYVKDQMVNENGASNETADGIMRSMLNSDISYALISYNNEVPFSEDMIKNCTYYANNTIFTIVYHKDEAVYESSGGSRFAKRTSTADLKLQIDFQEGKEAIRLSETNKTTREYTRGYDGYVADDVAVNETKRSFEITITAENVDEKAVNLSKYSYIENAE